MTFKNDVLGVRDPGPGSGKTYPRSLIPDLGVKKAPDPDPQHCNRYTTKTDEGW